MKHDATRELFAYWNALRGERAAPERCDVDPAAIRAILPDTFMLDVAAGFPMRIAGTRVGALLDCGGRGDRCGGDFLALWQRHERHNITAVLDAVLDGARPIVVGAAGAPPGWPACSFEFLFLPLRHFGRTHSRILGIVTPSAVPQWLGSLPLKALAVRSLRVIGPEETAARPPHLRGEMPYAARRREDRSPLERSEGMGAAQRLLARRPVLRLIEGGRVG